MWHAHGRRRPLSRSRRDALSARAAGRPIVVFPFDLRLPGISLLVSGCATTSPKPSSKAVTSKAVATKAVATKATTSKAVATKTLAAKASAPGLLGAHLATTVATRRVIFMAANCPPRGGFGTVQRLKELAGTIAHLIADVDTAIIDETE